LFESIDPSNTIRQTRSFALDFVAVMALMLFGCIPALLTRGAVFV
jgi:hypothetical protein